MSAHVYGPPRRRKHNIVGHTPPQKWWGRLSEKRYRDRIPLADIIDDAKAVVLRQLVVAPVEVPRRAWRHRDHWLAPAVALIFTLPPLLFLSAIQPWHRLPRPLEVLGCLAATGVICWYFAQEHHAALLERRRIYWQRELDRRINGLKVVAPVEREHATTLVCAVAPGLNPDDYEAQLGALTNSFKAPVYITNETPARLELRIQHDDLLAAESPWTPGAVTPRAIPVGHDWDGQPVTFDLTHSSLLVAGVRGSGKSAFLNGIIAHLAAMENVQLWIVDPLEGVDLGRWWPFAQEVADTEEMGVKVIEGFEERRASRVRSMRHNGRGVQIARWSAKWPMRVLIIDELASLALRGDKKQRDHFAETLHSIASKGRKSNDCLIAATQHPSVDVIPQLVRGQMTNVLGLRMARREQGRQVFGDGVVADWDLSRIPADRPGQGVWFNGTDFTMARTAGLYGAQLRRQVHLLDQDRKARLADETDDEAGLTSDPQRAGEKEGLTNVGEADADRVNELRDVLPADGSTVLYADIRARLPQIPKASLDRMLAKRDGVAQRVSRGVYRRRP